MFDSGSARVHALLLLIIVLLLGVIIGGSAIVFFSMHMPGPEAAAPDVQRGRVPRLHERIRGNMHPGPHERMFQELQLTEDQRKEVHRILANRRTEMDALLKSTQEELTTILTEEQAQHFETMRPPAPPRTPAVPHPR